MTEIFSTESRRPIDAVVVATGVAVGVALPLALAGDSLARAVPVTGAQLRHLGDRTRSERAEEARHG